MERHSDQEKEAHTSNESESKENIQSVNGGDEAEVTMSRRALLITAGTATASVAGYIDPGGTESQIVLQGIDVYGYGGQPVMTKASQTVTVSESEPNDRQKEAMKIDFDTEIQGNLEQADVDWFAFDGESGQTVVAEFSRAATEGVTSLILYGPDGDSQDLRFIGTSQPVQLEETLETTGTHYIEVVDVQKSSGDYTLTLTTESDTSTATPTPTTTDTATPMPTSADGQTPFNELPVSLPGRIQAQNFDTGGEGVAHSDTSDENKYDTSYRDSAVDIRETQDVSGTYNVGYFEQNEWLEYTVDTTSGTYDVHLRIATPRDDRQLRLLIEGETIATVNIPNTGGWRDWQTTTVENVTISTDDTRVLRVEAVNSGIDFNWLEFERADDTQTATATPTQTETSISTPTPTPLEDEYGEQAYGEYSYGGVDS